MMSQINSAEKNRILSLSDDLFPWSHFTVAREFIKDNTVFLNLSGDFAEKLLPKKYPPSKINAVSGIDDEIKEALKNAGASFYDDMSSVPDGLFTLITGRFEPFNVRDVKSKLKKGGHIIMEEYGFETYRSVCEALNIDVQGIEPSFNLENRAEELKKEGFKIVFRNQTYVERTIRKAEFLRFAELLPFISDVRSDEINDTVKITEHRFIYTAKKLN